MNKININLLPGEVVVLKQDQSRKKIFTFSSIGFLILMVILSGGILFFRILQNRNLQAVNQDLNQAQSKVASLKTQEGLVSFLKQRLGTINSILGQDSKQVRSYNLISALTPPGTKILSLTTDKNGVITLTAVSSGSDNTKKFLDNLLDPTTNQGKVSKVHMDSFNRSGDGFYKMDLTVNTI